MTPICTQVRAAVRALETLDDPAAAVQLTAAHWQQLRTELGPWFDQITANARLMGLEVASRSAAVSLVATRRGRTQQLGAEPANDPAVAADPQVAHDPARSEIFRAAGEGVARGRPRSF